MSGTGLVVDPAAAQAQIAEEQPAVRPDVAFPGGVEIEVHHPGSGSRSTGGQARPETLGAALKEGLTTLGFADWNVE